MCNELCLSRRQRSLGQRREQRQWQSGEGGGELSRSRSSGAIKEDAVAWSS